MEEQGTIHERIDKMIYHFARGNRTSFGRDTEILPGVLASIVGGRLSKPSFEVLQKILLGYPTISAEWLLMGKGPMLKQEVETEQPSGTTKPTVLRPDDAEGQREREAKLVKAVALLAAAQPNSEAARIVNELLPFHSLAETEQGQP